jgi:hypothetical protein
VRRCSTADAGANTDPNDGDGGESIFNPLNFTNKRLGRGTEQSSHDYLHVFWHIVIVAPSKERIA